MSLTYWEIGLVGICDKFSIRHLSIFEKNPKKKLWSPNAIFISQFCGVLDFWNTQNRKMNNLFRFICFGLIFPGESECHIHKTRNTEKTIEICKTTEVKEWNIEIWQSSHTRSDVNQPLSMNRSTFFSHFFNKVFKVWLKGGIERTRREEKWMKGY